MDRRTFLALPIASVIAPTAQAMLATQAELQSDPLPTAEQIDFTSNLPATGTFPAKWI